MLASRTGSSTDADARSAGAAAARKASEGLSNPKVAFVYASVAYNLGEMLAGIKREMPETQVIGNTVFTGVVMPEGIVAGDKGFVGMLALADGDLTVGTAIAERGDCPRTTGAALAREAMKAAGKTCPPEYFYLVASPGEEEFYLKGIAEVIGRVPCFGGSAADNTIAGEWKLYAGEKIVSNGAAVAFFYTDKEMKNVFTGAYHETDDVGIITKVEGKRTLMEIDGKPALERYAAWRNMKAADLKGGALLVATITSPLGVKDRLGDLVAIRHPMNGNDDLSMAIGANLAEKTAVIRMEATVDELVSSASDTLEVLKKKMMSPPAAYLLVHCGGRRAGIGDRLDEVARGVKKAAGDVPFIMNFTFGEYGFEDDGNNTTGGLMLSYTGFGK